ncbi:MAG: fasciclin domain-containing protein [Acidobacteria bacterium]|nr:fasciclin domain-containing protein [Acidobacteriota bacterium]
MKRTIMSAILVIAAAVVAFAQELKPIPNPPITKTVVETLRAAGNFNTFLSLLERAGMQDGTVRGPNNNAGGPDNSFGTGLKNLGFIPTDSGNAGTATRLPTVRSENTMPGPTLAPDTTAPGTLYQTVFAPNDAAFAKLPKGALDALKKDPQRLRAFLLAHIVPGKLTTSELLTRLIPEGSSKTFQSRQGSLENLNQQGRSRAPGQRDARAVLSIEHINPFQKGGDLIINGKVHIGKFQDVMTSDYLVVIHEVDAVLFYGWF